MSTNAVVKQNVVPNNAARKAALSKGIMYRFGYEPILGTNLCKVGEVVFMSIPDVDTLKNLHQSYCAAHNIDEQFIPADYGY